MQLLGKETEKFGGDTLLNGQEQLHQIKQTMEGWTDSALKVFGRHRGLEGRQHPDQENMVKLNEVTKCPHHYQKRHHIICAASLENLLFAYMGKERCRSAPR